MMTRRRKWIRVALLTVFAAALIGAGFRRPLRRSIVAAIVLHNDGPSEGQLAEVASGQPTAADGMMLLWSASKMPHRHFVMSELREHRQTARDSWERLHPLVVDAAASRDVDLFEPGLMVLGRNSPEEGVRAAAAALSDADPEIRTAGIRTIAELHDLRYLDSVIDRLDDDESIVRVQAYEWLATLTHARIEVDLKDHASIAAGIDELRHWAWTKHAGAAPAPAAGPAPATTPIAAPDFSVDDVMGNHVNLAALRGKRVLLNFFTTYCPPCLAEVPTLRQLQQTHANDLVVVGICADTIREDDGDAGLSAADALPRVLSTMKRLNITWPVILDGKGSIVAAYGGSGVPLCVLIDPRGIVRRRFLGPRTPAALERMLATVDSR